MLHALYSISQHLNLKPKRRLGVARGPAVLVARVLGTGSVAGGAYENDTRSTDPVIPADLAALPRHTVCFFRCYSISRSA